MNGIERTTLACIDCQSPTAAKRALEISLRQCSYPRAVLFTDAAIAGAGFDVIAIPRIATSADYSRFLLKDLIRHIDTEFVQIIQWDGYVINAGAWRAHFFHYDYIGARWWFRQPPHNVGNGGFSLRSRRLLEALQDADVSDAGPEDDQICLHSRAKLEQRHGIRIAPGEVADLYAFEGTKPTGREFGFHRFFNFPHFHDEAELAAAIALAPPGSLSGEAGLTFLRKLIYLGRGREALSYGARALEHGVSAEFKQDFVAVLQAEEKRARRRGRGAVT